MENRQLDLYLTAQELGKALGITSQAVHKFCNENSIPKISSGKVDKIYPEAVKELLRARKVPFPTSPMKCAFHTVKGGAGKTTLCYALATRAVCYGYRVLVIDLDKQSNLTLSFTLDPKEVDLKNFLDLYEDSSKGLDLDYDDYIIEVNPYLHLLPANLRLANLDILLQLNSANIGDIMPRLLGGIESCYDLILFDLACDFNRVSMATHAYVDKVIVPTDPQEFAVYGVELTYDHVAQVEKEWRNSPDKSVIVNKFNASHTTSYEIIANLKNTYGDDLCETVVSTSRPLADAMGKKKCLWALSRKRIPALDEIDEIARNVLGVNSWRSQRNAKQVAESSHLSVEI